eukprot:jgi/Botrbrau1/18435/Bobra.0072s0023.1
MFTSQLPARPGLSTLKGVAPVVPKPAAIKPGRRSLVTRNVLELSKEANGSGPLEFGKSLDPSNLEKDILSKAVYDVGVSPKLLPNKIPAKQAYQALARSVREALIESFNATNDYWSTVDPKFVYYLSAEFLMGRSLTNTLWNLGIEGPYGKAVRELGYTLEQLQEEEQNASLGNGGLGRLAACFIDSMANLDLPGWGYGIRYDYGMFKQTIDDLGNQFEVPDIWLSNGNPWELRRDDLVYPIHFYGEVVNGKWAPSETVLAKAYDNPIPGYHTKTVGNLRLWQALSPTEFDLQKFNDGKYDEARQKARAAADISAVLYPNDATEEGKALRLKQQYFFVSASIQDVLARFKEKHPGQWDLLPEKAVFQMNDTHPTSAVTELMRLLIDVEGLDWDHAWNITKKTLAFTNHTVMPEALEKWPVSVFGKLLPRNYEIVLRINKEWLASLRPLVEEELKKNPPPPAPKPVKKESEKSLVKGAKLEPLVVDPLDEALKKYSIITENPWEPGKKLINMAYMAIVGSSYVNGVAAIHSQILKDDLFKDFYALFPEKFQNKTNGVTPRRWLAFANPELAALITATLGSDNWIKHTDELVGLRKFADDLDFHAKWRAIKQDNKARLAAKVKEITGIEIPVDAMYDIQIKRIHEYKRQYMNILSVIYRYKMIKEASPEDRKKFVPRVVMIGGKAASAYYMAKKIVHLITSVGRVVNNDPDVKDLLKVVFIPDYNVSLAEVIIPASELSQHISTAGTEASGTSNMKFQMNGCLIIGTLDGANIEIAQESGQENLFIFGEEATEIARLREERKDYKDYDPRFLTAIKMIKDGVFGEKEYFEDLADSVSDMTKGNDWFLVANDFTSYMAAQEDVDILYRDQEAWTKRSILMTAGSGFFSSDRTIREYAKDIWHIKPTPLP